MRPIVSLIAAVALVAAGVFAQAALAHPPCCLTVTAKTETSIGLDWAQSPYDHSYDGYYVRADGGTRVYYSASQGTMTGLKPGVSYQMCVSVNFTGSADPDEGPQACVRAATAAAQLAARDVGVGRPYADSSRWNALVSSPVVKPNSSQIVSRLTGTYNGPARLTVDEDAVSDYSHPRIHASSTDPLYTVKLSVPWAGNIGGMKVRIPNGARWAGWPGTSSPTDRHIAIIQPPGPMVSGDPSGVQWEVDCHQVTAIDTTRMELGAQYCGRLDVSGSGLGGGSTVANFGLLAGMIRSNELIAGNIPHALFATVKCSNGTHESWLLTNGNGAKCSTVTSGDPPLGQRFYYDASEAYIDGLNVPAWKKTILRALKRYGAYFGDTGGPGFSLMLESPETYRSVGKPDPLVGWAAENGVPLVNGKYRLDLRTGVDWSRLKAIDP